MQFTAILLDEERMKRGEERWFLPALDLSGEAEQSALDLSEAQAELTDFLPA